MSGVKIQLRHDTAANWTTENPVLAAGEFGVEDDTNLFKKGDGVTAWNALAYANAGAAGIPAGGAAGQGLIKNSASDFDVSWGIPSPIDGGVFT